LLREALGPEPWLVVPGVRLPGDPAGDQSRVVEPRAAARSGATHLVVGRSVTQARDPVAAWTRVREAVA
jgi:orotidine-5'-phosphate decarboxylase